jgi:hypothetical protein
LRLLYDRRMRITLGLTLLGLAACGSKGSSNNTDAPGGSGIDAPGTHVDAEGIDAPAGPPITVSGTADSVGATGRKALAGVTIGAYHETATSPSVTATSAADGTYSTTVPTENGAVDGYIKGTIASYVDTYLYPPAPLTMNTTGANVLMVEQGTLDALYTFTGVTEATGDGIIAIEVVDSTGALIAGAAVASTPTYTVKYNKGGIPSGSATVTDTDGIAYIMNVAPGTVSVTATKTGDTIPAHNVNVRASVFTTTEIVSTVP